MKSWLKSNLQKKKNIYPYLEAQKRFAKQYLNKYID